MSYYISTNAYNTGKRIACHIKEEDTCDSLVVILEDWLLTDKTTIKSGAEHWVPSKWIHQFNKVTICLDKEVIQT